MDKLEIHLVDIAPPIIIGEKNPRNIMPGGRNLLWDRVYHVKDFRDRWWEVFKVYDMGFFAAFTDTERSDGMYYHGATLEEAVSNGIRELERMSDGQTPGMEFARKVIRRHYADRQAAFRGPSKCVG